MRGQHRAVSPLAAVARTVAVFAVFAVGTALFILAVIMFGFMLAGVIW